MISGSGAKPKARLPYMAGTEVDTMLIIIPGTIRPQSNDRLVQTDVGQRKEQYRETVRNVLKAKGVHKVVFCDNSGEDLSDFLPEYALDERLELLSYTADASKVQEFGKGYGEGDILRYVLEHSKLIEGEESFVKLTGRLNVTNLSKVLSKLEPGKNYFQGMYMLNKKHLADTRFYCVTVSDYKAALMDVHIKVNDKDHVYLEHVFSEAVRTSGMKYRNMPVYPEIVGISGSSGKTYGLPFYKRILKQIMAGLNLMKV